ncbi:hypothetical protein EMIHUDRAFT_257178 [Emiliania huxleyi CCMP1516]|uniref:Ubiquitin-like domain-containing protein n=2 Tax=Emiliania huxleyi TaxID=2903 RepID=A0A0D3IM13_EMIH1|nr:hypothetical protein EMIHUDRAFT_257178 [Emiliania huxleyi CCMP1516]EOD12298.1 hypothetical protein EMIHUDRAFT_257178 [Emiliania huxleyi CCMP1516]|eukprot:XP_005764727.1 hypothetical protein EMIHUDRAFT_257178 [Emiliania huxleyi CCMP1516]
MLVKIKVSSNGQTLSIDAAPADTVVALKEKIAEASSVPAAQQRLIYSGKVLQDSQSLESYHVEEGHMIHMRP